MLLALLLVAFSVIQAASGVGAKDSDEREIGRLEAEWNAAHVRGDVTALERTFAEDLVVIVPGMRVMMKADSLGMFTSGRMKFECYETSETKIRTYDDAAIVTDRLRRARLVTGASAEDDWRFTKVYLRRDGRWQVVSFRASNTNR